jgi:hypothetical protein
MIAYGLRLKLVILWLLFCFNRIFRLLFLLPYILISFIKSFPWLRATYTKLVAREDYEIKPERAAGNHPMSHANVSYLGHAALTFLVKVFVIVFTLKQMNEIILFFGA